MRFACTTCASPAVSLPLQLLDDALVQCQGCNRPVAAWAAFKRRTTQVILAEIKEIEADLAALSPDPLDRSVLLAHDGRTKLAS